MLLTDYYYAHVERCKNAIKQFFQIVSRQQNHNGNMLLVALGGHYKLNIPWFVPIADRMRQAGTPFQEYDILDHDLLQPELETNHIIKLISESYNNKSANFEAETAEIIASKDANAIGNYWRKHETIVGLEFLIYLKVWEMDSFLRQLYQLAKIANGESYDWYLEISASKNEQTATLHKYKKNEIRDSIKANLGRVGANDLLALFNEGYLNHLRNAIAHSQYYFINQRIDLPKYQKDIQLKEWLEKLYPLTLALYSTFTDEIQKVVVPEYERIAIANNNRIQVILGDGRNANLVYHPDLSPGHRWRF